MTLARWNMLKKLGTCHAPAPPCNFLCAPVPGLTCSISLHVLAGVACLADVRADEHILHAAVAHRRRATVAALHHFASGSSGQGPQGSKVKFDTEFSWSDHVARLSDRDFKLRYRLTLPAFNELLEMLRSHLKVQDEDKARVAKWGELITEEAKLACALRYLAGGDVKDLQLIYHFSPNHVYKCIWLVVDAVNEVIKIEFPLKDVAKLKVLEAEFRAASRGGIWKGQVGAVDGVHFPMLGPGESDVPDPMRYYVPRKGMYAMLCMAMCDSKRRFTFYACEQASTTHDSLAWALSDLGAAINKGELPIPFFINADSAFQCGPSMRVPSGDPDLDDYDFHQSSNRMPIECAFGILIHRWGVLWKPLKVRFDRRAPLIAACMRLHNFCIDKGVEDELRAQHGMTEVVPGRWATTPKYDRDGRPVEYGRCLEAPCGPSTVSSPADTPMACSTAPLVSVRSEATV